MSYQTWIRRHRRNVGFLMGVPVLLLARWEDTYALYSTILVVFGETLRIWAAGYLHKEETLATGGPYRFIRNPLYLGSFLIAIGFCLITGSFWIWLLVSGYFLLCYLPVIRWEESVLEEKFQDEFRRYRASVPAFYPSLRLHPAPTGRFSFRQMIKNKEYNAVLGILAVYGYLIFLRDRLSALFSF